MPIYRLMKQVHKLFWLFVAMLLFISQPSAQAGDMFTKLGRGVGNIGFAPYELVNQPAQMAKTERWFIAVVGGIPKGVLFAVARAAVGVYETVTFPIPVPKDYRIIMYPEFVFPSY